MGMKKPLPPAVSTSHAISSAGARGGKRRVSAGGPNSATATTPCSVGSSSDLYPLVGRDVLLGYGSLSAAAILTTAAATAVGAGGNKTTIAEAVEPPKLRPMSSMENVEFAWSPASSATPASPTAITTTTEADGKAVVSATSWSGNDAATTTPVMSLDPHSGNPDNKFSCPAGSGFHSSVDSVPAGINNRRNRNESGNSTTSRSSILRHRQNSDQHGRGGLSKPLPPAVAAGKVSLDQQSIHPLQMDPDLAPTTEEDADAVAEAKGDRTTTMLTKDDDVGQDKITATTPTTTLPLSEQPFESSSLSTPVSMASANSTSSLDAASAGPASGVNHGIVPSSSQQQPKEEEQQQQLRPQQVIRKKTSFAAKLRKVFNNSKSLPPNSQDHQHLISAHSNHAASMTNTAVTSTVSQQEQTQEDIISLTSGDDLYGSGRPATHAEMVAFMDQQQQHRGSVSSASSADTDVQQQQQHPHHRLHHHVNSTFRRRSSQSQTQTDTPSTSPEATPCGSPTGQSTLNAIMTGAPAAFAITPTAASASEFSPIAASNDSNLDAHHHQYCLHPLSGSESSSSPSVLDVKSASSSALATGISHVVFPISQMAADIASDLQQPVSETNPTRTVKKRLSFASISSLFSPRNGASGSNSATSQQEARAKQQRASSVPHIENPLVTVGRQIAGFQRRHSLNDLHGDKAATAAAAEATPKISRVGVNSLEKNPNALPPTPGQGSSPSAGTASSSNAPVASRTPTPSKPTKKLSLNIVFNKGLRKKKNAAAASKPESPLPAKPLRSALANRNNGNNMPGQTATAQSSPKVHLVHRSASRRRSASIRSQGSAHRRHHRNSHHSSHHHHHHHHHHHNAQQHTDPFARLAEANHALANLNRRGSQDQAALRHLQQQQLQDGGFSDEFAFCTSPQTFEAPAGGLPTPLDTHGLRFHHHNQSQEDLPISSTKPTADELNRSSSAKDVSTKASDGTSQSRPDAHPISFNRPKRTQQKNVLSTLSPSSSCCSYSSSLSSDRVKDASFRLTSDDVEFCSSSSSFSKQDAIAPDSTIVDLTSTTGSSSTTGSLSSRRGSADHGPAAVFNPLLPASAARVSVNRIVMENQQQVRGDHSSDTNSNDGSATGSSHESRSVSGGSQGGKSNDSETLYDHRASSASATASAAAAATAAALSLALNAESASAMSNSSTEASSTTSSTASANSPPTKKSLSNMNMMTEDVSEEEAMIHAQLAYIQQQQQQYLVQQTQPHQHQQQQEHHHHHHHVHYLPHSPPQHLPHSHYHPSHRQPDGDYEPIPSQPHHHQPYYYPHPSLFPPRPPRQLQFSTKEPLVFPTWTPEQYDRTSDAYITASRLTPAMANKIKLELNQFKSQEMLVHEESRVYTHFFM
ncbi:bud neck involved protein [Mortierella sp. 14UC]|nr:bud neck involved protein [Mortierella sp. 14UC]